jgi:TLD
VISLYRYIDIDIQIVSNVPSVFKTGNWKSLYVNQIHGSSLNTLLKLNEHYSPCILVVKELQSGQIFGAYLSEYLHTVMGSFFGGGETFLFTLKDGNIRTYQWTQKNQHFIFCDSHGIGIGCGDKFGLFLKGDLTGGYSTKCDTFDNEILSTSEDF